MTSASLLHRLIPLTHACAGFRNVAVQDFAEEDGALDAPGRKWRLPRTVIVAER